MIQVEVNGEKRRWGEIGPNWVAQQITQRRNDGHKVCVRVHVAELNRMWSTPTCPSVGGGGGGAAVRSEVRQISELFNEHQLNREDFAPGNVISFIEAVERTL